MIEKPQAEDLNLERMREGIIKRCWMDTKNFPNVPSIAKVTGLNPKTIYRIANKLDLVRAKR